jgi:hypothetical protein
MGSALWAEAVGTRREVRLIDRLEHRLQRALDDVGPGQREARAGGACAFPAWGSSAPSSPAASSIRPPATRTVETAASPILRGLLVGDPVGMLFRNHVEELDQTASELLGQLFKPQAQCALALDAGVAEPVLDVPDIVLTLRERLDRLVVSAVTDIATLRAEIPEPQTGSMKTALLRGRHTSDHGFEMVATGSGLTCPTAG